MELPRHDRIPSRAASLAVVIMAGLGVLLGGVRVGPAFSDDLPKGTNDRRAAVGQDNSAVEADSRAASEKEAPIAPELLYLAWQGARNADGKAVPHKLWDIKGNVLPEEKAKEVLARVGSFHVHWWKPADELRPLVLVFRVDPKTRRSGIMVAVIDDRHRSYEGGTGIYAVKDGLTVSSAVPRKSELGTWPERISLDVNYPLEDYRLLKTVETIPNEPIPVSEGVEWLVEDGRGLKDRRPAAVLRFEEGKGDWRLHKYEALCYLRGRPAPLSREYVTIIDKDGVSCQIDVSPSFTGAHDVEKVEFRRQRHAVTRIEKIPLRLDLLPADQASEPSDER